MTVTADDLELREYFTSMGLTESPRQGIARLGADELFTAYINPVLGLTGSVLDRAKRANDVGFRISSIARPGGSAIYDMRDAVYFFSRRGKTTQVVGLGYSHDDNLAATATMLVARGIMNER